jgi:quercetin dioxygenase-like cupin family protein
LVDWEK